MRFTLADLVTAAFASVLLAAGALAGVPRTAPGPYAFCAAALALPLLSASLRARLRPLPGTALRLAIDFAMLPSLLLVFDNLGPFITALHPVDLDPWLIAADRLLVGADPTRLLSSLATPFLLDVLTVCYALYYFHPLVLAGLLWRDDVRTGGRATRFAPFAFTVLTVFYVSYAGYFAVPAIGPRYTVVHDAPLPRGAVSAAIDGTLDRLEKNKRNCFPSGHTMVTLTVLAEAWRRSRKTFAAFLPFAAGLLVATVFCRYHYLTDVLAGGVLTAVVVPLSRRIAARVPQEDDGTVLATTR